MTLSRYKRFIFLLQLKIIKATDQVYCHFWWIPLYLIPLQLIPSTCRKDKESVDDYSPTLSHYAATEHAITGNHLFN